MKAVVYREKGRVSLEDVPKPVIINPDDAIVRITSTSICGTDLHIMHGHLDMEPGTIIGHEFTGVVDEVGPSVFNVQPGDLVLGAAGCACGICPACRGGKFTACPHFAIYGCGPSFGNLHGAQAEFIRVPFANGTLIKIPGGMTEEQILFAGDILCTAYMGAEGGYDGNGIQRGSTVVVYGAGPVGLCTVAVSRFFGPAVVIAIDLEDYRLEMATRLGADLVINPSRQDPVDLIKKLTGGWGADYVVEASGSPAAFASAANLLAPMGAMALISIMVESLPIPTLQLISNNNTLKMGLANLRAIPQLIRLIYMKKLDVTPLITHRMPLDRAVEAYDIFDNKRDGVIKVILNP